jgi:hypothetical protein
LHNFVFGRANEKPVGSNNNIQDTGVAGRLKRWDSFPLWLAGAKAKVGSDFFLLGGQLFQVDLRINGGCESPQGAQDGFAVTELQQP